MKNHHKNIIHGLAGIIIFIFTFPSLHVTHYNGLDASYFWALNYFFSDYREFFNQLIFPFGPLGFLKSPFFIGNNFGLGLVFISVSRILLITFLFILSRKNRNNIVFTVLATFVILFFSNIDFAIIGIVLSGLLLYNDSNKFHYLVVSVIFSSIAVFIKSSLGLSCFSIIITFSIYEALRRNYLIFPLWMLTFSLTGILIFGSINGFFQFIYSTARMIAGYTQALALFPENNWFLIGLSITVFAIIPFVVKSKHVYLIYGIMLFISFSQWKHAMVREDIFHNRIFLIYLILFYGFVSLYLNRKTFWLVGLMLVSVFSFGLNMRNIPGFEKALLLSNGPKNFYETIIRFNDFKSTCEVEVAESLKKMSLDNASLYLIGNSTIDIFPNELSYVPSNKLNWKPRPTLQAGAYSPWIDSISSASLGFQNGPEFLLFHLTSCRYNTKLGSLDNRYLLNDEPKSVFQIFSNYSIQHSTREYLLLKKQNEPILKKPEIKKTEKVLWKEWITVPECKDEITRLKFSYSKKLIAKLKEFMYKGEYFQIDYKFFDGKIHSYRFNPETAEAGIWINPFIVDFSNPEKNKKVESVRFSCSSSNLMKEHIFVEWESIQIIDRQKNNMFAYSKDSLSLIPVFIAQNNFEKQSQNDFNNVKADSTIVFDGKYSNMIEKNGFSTSINIPVDSLLSKTDNIEIFASCQAFLTKKSNALFVLSVENEGKAKLWLSQPLDRLFYEGWNYNQFITQVDLTNYANHILKFYIWNPKGEVCWIDNMKIEISSSNKL